RGRGDDAGPRGRPLGRATLVGAGAVGEPGAGRDAGGGIPDEVGRLAARRAELELLAVVVEVELHRVHLRPVRIGTGVVGAVVGVRPAHVVEVPDHQAGRRRLAGGVRRPV